MEMYSDKVNTDYFNVSIDGYDLIAEEVTPNEAYNRRETSRKNIIGGTQTVIRTNYIPRDYTFVTHFIIDPLYPDVYDNIFREWQSKNVEVISKHMGGKFQAECIVKPTPNDSPNYLRVEIQLVEVPDTNSLIPGDEFTVPVNKDENAVKITSKSKKNKSKKKTKTSNKKNSKKNSSKKNSSKGSNITKTKKK